MPMMDASALKISILLYPKFIFELGRFLLNMIPSAPTTNVKLSVIKCAASLIIARLPAM